jgi:HemY protein
MARAFTAARDPAWTADGFVSERWLPVSPVTGRLDAFQWKVPVADIGERAPVLIEAAPEEAPSLEAPVLPVNPPPLQRAAPIARTASRAAPIIPLTQVPDDPGPEPEDAELDTGRRETGWKRIRQFFH